jgi:RNA polymerase sigma-70 factor (ECF subfamily)
MAKSLLRTDSEIAEIYTRQVAAVYRLCFTYLKNAADAEDATADTFVRLLQSAPAFAGGEHEKAWLLRTAINICKDNLKHWWRKRADWETVSDTLETKSVLADADVTAVVLALPERYKAVVYLYYFEGYTAAQIAALLRKPSSTVRNHLHEARGLLKERLGDDFDEEQ